jgi:hypothetical protein
MFTVLFIASALAAATVPLAKTYGDLLFAGFFLGLAGTSGGTFSSRPFCLSDPFK